MYRIIADEADFLLIDKAPGVHFHSQDGSAGVVAQAESDLGIKLYSVHRLDTLTSGLIILAKSSAAAAEFTELFSQHGVQKYYLALARGKPKKKQGKIAGDMAKSRRSQYKLLRTMENPAVTQFVSASVAEGLRAYLLRPLTGKTHQLRVALASLGTPILGDALYGGAPSDRGYLHAWQLEFQFRGQEYRFETKPSVGEEFTSEALSQLLENDWRAPSSLDWPGR
ncbi:TIGR01621 family pseudouridine synthase [Shewanella litorisediminis]|uniref:TIGR01621 family pseudouridine synthase n=1 Tax=Shewanella litorisediminis TaxID=1173586 RepID=A0ABX7G359_9GAMM|nr:TIGR01621 family pseudouridine synthase [Shewanella litorisediminis]MCL2917276.1 TIGR01621 family pseudouridine synthase [Shewanella litorisediminis]QRH01746.1 TIGR01621 family pseudouridine synthase [Shewanella litorisediminis]